jgi:hypothetical protein
MPRTNPHRRFVEALESIANSSSRLARSMEDVAALEREKTGWLRALFARMWRGGRGSEAAPSRRYRGDGGLSDGAPNMPLGPGGPSGMGALPSGERPCINVTPPKTLIHGRMPK